MKHVLRSAAMAAALMIGSTVMASAQGGPPGGGGGPGGGGRRMDQMASLERPMAGVDGVTDAQKDTLAKIEAEYKVKFTASGTAMREMMMAARQSGGAPDMAAMGKMRADMASMRTQELALVRGLLTAAQHPKFDENVKALMAEDAQRDAQMRARMGGGAPPR
jgi:hypothetical protein